MLYGIKSVLVVFAAACFGAEALGFVAKDLKAAGLFFLSLAILL